MPKSLTPEIADRYYSDESHFEHVFQELFVPALEMAGYHVIAPAFAASSDITHAETVRNLEAADLALCDVSTENANVFFELGIRTALDRAVALVQDNTTSSTIFDDTVMSVYTYDARLRPWLLREEVPRLSAYLKSVGKQEQNALWRYFGIRRRAAVVEPGDPVQAKLDLLLTEVKSRARTLDHQSASDKSTEEMSRRRLYAELDETANSAGADVSWRLSPKDDLVITMVPRTIPASSIPELVRGLQDVALGSQKAAGLRSVRVTISPDSGVTMARPD